MTDTSGPVPESEETPGRKRALPSWVAIAAGIAALIFAVVVISNVAAPLAGLIAPADPPLFQPAALIEHRDLGDGEEEWLYASTATGCDVYLWYAERAEYCRPVPESNCDATISQATDSVAGSEQSIGYCQGSVPFGDFATNWEIYISDGYTGEDGRTRFLIAREIDWMGGS
jgi:hypothetical protein